MRTVYAACFAVDAVVVFVGTVSMRPVTVIVGSLAMVTAVIASASVSDGGRW